MYIEVPYTPLGLSLLKRQELTVSAFNSNPISGFDNNLIYFNEQDADTYTNASGYGLKDGKLKYVATVIKDATANTYNLQNFDVFDTSGIIAHYNYAQLTRASDVKETYPVYLAKDYGTYNKDLNVYISGDVIVNDGLCSNFSSNNYIVYENTVPDEIVTLEQVICFSQTDTSGNWQCLTAGHPYVGIASLVVAGTDLCIYESSNMIENDVANGRANTDPLPFRTNPVNYIKYTYNKTDGYRHLEYSADGITWSNIWLHWTQLPFIFKGFVSFGCDIGSAYQLPFWTPINIKNSYIKINGSYWWKPNV